MASVSPATIPVRSAARSLTAIVGTALTLFLLLGCEDSADSSAGADMVADPQLQQLERVRHQLDALRERIERLTHELDTASGEALNVAGDILDLRKAAPEGSAQHELELDEALQRLDAIVAEIHSVRASRRVLDRVYRDANGKLTRIRRQVESRGDMPREAFERLKQQVSRVDQQVPDRVKVSQAQLLVQRQELLAEARRIRTNSPAELIDGAEEAVVRDLARATDVAMDIWRAERRLAQDRENLEKFQAVEALNDLVGSTRDNIHRREQFIDRMWDFYRRRISVLRDQPRQEVQDGITAVVAQMNAVEQLRRGLLERVVSTHIQQARENKGSLSPHRDLWVTDIREFQPRRVPDSPSNGNNDE